ncbi:hypothetical protein KSK55_10285 [Methanospirillum purgamenti]|jgi:hypothetical protein|uniref:Uncharacterized protein n=1 Tax=Methanospirillum hungatei TaxID=2203 RepID=A0A8F5VLL8_METHU|nr:type II toxin-antitoxin system HicA family toxin [Methanospirillum hungatei]QXO93740.1 hypothetical protein KSK55_10285 [Methanospirillum hungatei]
MIHCQLSGPSSLDADAFLSHGFTKARLTGIHVIMVKHGVDVTLSIPFLDLMTLGTTGTL